MHMIYIYIYIYDVHWTFVRSFWMLPEIVLAAHLLSVCVQPPAILPNNIVICLKQRTIWIWYALNPGTMSGQIWNFEGCNFDPGDKRLLQVWSGKKWTPMSRDPQDSTERWCDNATWPGWISLRMALKIRCPMVPHGTHWRIIIPTKSTNFWCPIFTHWYLTEFEMPGTLAVRCPRRAIAQQNREEEARLKAGGFAERCSVAFKDFWKDAVLILTLKECSWFVQHVHLAKGQEMDFMFLNRRGRVGRALLRFACLLVAALAQVGQICRPISLKVQMELVKGNTAYLPAGI